MTVSPDSMIKVAEHAGNHGKHFAMNLSAPFLAQFFKDPMLKVRYSEKATKFLTLLINAKYNIVKWFISFDVKKIV